MKKGRDSRDVFAVFKKDSFMKDATFGKKLAYWFKNIYWCYFALPTVGIIAAALIVGGIAYDITHPEYNDIDFVVAGSLLADKEQMDMISDRMKAFIDPYDDENGPKIGYQSLCTRSIVDQAIGKDAIDDGTRANIEKITLTMTDDDVLLFFFDKKYIEWYADDGAFEPLENFGIESEDEYFVRVDETPFFKDIGISHYDGIYAGIKVRRGPRLKDNERMNGKYINAANVLSGILAYK